MAEPQTTATSAQIPVAPGPVMDVVAPPATVTEAKPAPAKSPAQQPARTAAKSSKTSAKQGVTAAIFATVIIVLGLALLAVYAYLKQNGR